MCPSSQVKVCPACCNARDRGRLGGSTGKDLRHSYKNCSVGDAEGTSYRKTNVINIGCAEMRIFFPRTSRALTSFRGVNQFQGGWRKWSCYKLTNFSLVKLNPLCVL